MYPAPRILTLPQQHFALRASGIGGSGRLTRKGLEWRYSAKPTPVSRTYQLRMTYTLAAAPDVTVTWPTLVGLADGRRLPHVYSQDPARLCLYMPSTGEWRRQLTLAATVVPWSALWLYYFEDWLASGVWRGGGQHPTVASDVAGAS